MKKWTLFLCLYFCACLLAACGATGGSQSDAADTSQPEAITETFRIVTAEGPGHPPLLLAKVNGTAGEVYDLPSAENIPVTLEWVSEDKMEAIEWSYQAGSLVELTHDGMILETYPAQFSNVTAIHVLETGFDNRCAMYLDVLEDLWAKDSGLNNGVERIGVDLSETRLSPAEQSAVAWAFAGNHDVDLVQNTWDELVELGYITASSLCIDTSEASQAELDSYFYEWENGCFFSIAEQPMEGVYSLMPVTFDAQKWRSSLGAYWLCDCTAIQSAMGKWSDYTIGSEMIS